MGRRWSVALAMLLSLAAPAAAQEILDEGAVETPGPIDPIQRFASRFGLNEPLFFAVGWRKEGDARFQISFKYRFYSVEPGKKAHSWLANTYFGYTQTSIWDIEDDSLPFRDTSYRPSFFYLQDRLPRYSTETRHFGIQFGIEHESNGQGEDDSRSLNIAFFRPTWRFGELTDYHFTISPKFYVYVDSLSDNPDLDEYRGYVDFVAAWGKHDSWKAQVMLRKGTRAKSGSIQADVSYPLDRLISRNVGAFVLLQYFNGWGESLIDYNVKRPSQVRLGLMLVR